MLLLRLCHCNNVLIMMDVFIMETLGATIEKYLYEAMIKQVVLWKCNL
jgi:hypothetical protein